MAIDVRSLLFGEPVPSLWLDDESLPAEPDDLSEPLPGSPIQAARADAGAPAVDDLSLGGATAATALIPGGVDALPSSAFDRSNDTLDHALSDDQAWMVAQVTIAGALAEGEPERVVLEDLADTLRTFPGLEGFDTYAAVRCVEALTEGSETASALLRDLEGWFVDAADALTDPRLRRVAYQLAAYACAWDGVISDAEQEVLDALSEAFEIEPFESRALREWVLLLMAQDAWPEGWTVRAP
jgi:hypothetical protein